MAVSPPDKSKRGFLIFDDLAINKQTKYFNGSNGVSINKATAVAPH
jgi:hypothetical protein